MVSLSPSGGSKTNYRQLLPGFGHLDRSTSVRCVQIRMILPHCRGSIPDEPNPSEPQLKCLVKADFQYLSMMSIPHKDKFVAEL
jgi:hypothetical protein